MKQIAVLVGEHVTALTTGTNVLAATNLNKEARRNKEKILNASLTIENELAFIISHYFFGRSHQKKDAFEALILNSDWCSFAAKRKLIAHIIEEQLLLVGQEKSDFEKQLRNVMSYRNAFAHGIIRSDGVKVWLSFFEGKPRQQELTDEYLTVVEKTLNQTFNAVITLAQKSGAASFE